MGNTRRSSATRRKEVTFCSVPGGARKASPASTLSPWTSTTSRGPRKDTSQSSAQTMWAPSMSAATEGECLIGSGETREGCGGASVALHPPVSADEHWH